MTAISKTIFADSFLNEIFVLKFVPNCPIDNIWALDLIMAWRRIAESIDAYMCHQGVDELTCHINASTDSITIFMVVRYVSSPLPKAHLRIWNTQIINKQFVADVNNYLMGFVKTNISVKLFMRSFLLLE